MRFEVRPFSGFQTIPIVFSRDADLFFVNLAVFIGHLEKQKVGELFQIIAVTYAVISQSVAETPDF
jgi:hypothetical protein